MSAAPFAYVDGDKRWIFINRSKTTWTNELSLFTGDGRLVTTAAARHGRLQRRDSRAG